MANEGDHAVVIGIRRYADADDSTNWIGNLNGPDNDAAAVAEWLRDPAGGDVPAANVTLIRSADFPDPFPAADNAAVGPQQQAVEAALNDLAELPPTAYQGQYAGRRVYIYASGHGFSRAKEEAAIVTAEARRARPLNVLVTSWATCLWQAGRFQEYVLWVDACAVRRPLTFLKPCDRELENSGNAANTHEFRAFAAGYDKLAVEALINGEWHGVFTYALLKGLRGAAPRDANGAVTSNELSDYLINNMSSFMTDEQKADGRVAHEPSFPAKDRIVLVTPPQALEFPVTIRFPAAAVGRRVTVSTTATAPPVAEEELPTAEWNVSLPPGAYVAFVPDLNIFAAFAVTGGDDDRVVTVQ